MQSPEVFLVEPRPPRAALGRPEIARQAADEVLFAIVDLDELLPTLIAALFVADIGHGLNCSTMGMTGAPAISRRPRWPQNPRNRFPAANTKKPIKRMTKPLCTCGIATFA